MVAAGTPAQPAGDPRGGGRLSTDSAERTAADPGADAVAEQASLRRTFAVISHPDAGKSTLTEALALHAEAIGEAGHVHGKGNRRGVVSDWQSMEQARGISISSASIQLHRRGRILNLLDTPGHADFSEDTYRVLAAVDCAVMLIDAGKGMETQTRKLFGVCKFRGLPVITVVNKWDRPGKEALELLDEIEEATGMRPTPITWPVGIAGDFRGVLDRRDGGYVAFTRTTGGATRAPETFLDPQQAAEREGDAWTTAEEEVALLAEIGATHDEASFLAGETTPVLFAAAVVNFGVHQLLDTLIDVAPPPGARATVTEHPRPLESPFSGQVFKVQSGMDRAHRDRLAFVRVCSGRFERGMAVTNSRTGRPYTLKYAQQVFGADRHVVDEAFPGDVVGLVNANALQVGDTLYAGRTVTFPPIPSFAPEHFAVARAVDLGKAKQFQKGMFELDSEGVVQVMRSDRRGEQAPVLAAVGPLQFEVVTHRMEHEFRAAVTLDRLEYTLAMAARPEDLEILLAERLTEIVWRSDGTPLALFTDKWQLSGVRRRYPDVVLTPLVASD